MATTKANATTRRHDLGQSLWLDDMTCGLLTSGTLRQYIDERSLTERTSNPTIVDLAIERTPFYDDATRQKIDDAYSVKPLDTGALLDAVRTTGGRLCVVEDHWPEGGLGEAVLAALAQAGAAGEIVHFVHLAVHDMPGSGEPAELIDAAKIAARHIAGALQELALIPRRKQDAASA